MGLRDSTLGVAAFGVSTLASFEKTTSFVDISCTYNITSNNIIVLNDVKYISFNNNVYSTFIVQPISNAVYINIDMDVTSESNATCSMLYNVAPTYTTRISGQAVPIILYVSIPSVFDIKSFFYIKEGDVVDLDILYVIGLADRVIPHTLGVHTLGTHTFGVTKQYADIDPVHVNVVAYLNMKYDGVGTLWTDLAFFRRIWCIMNAVVTSEVYATFARKGKDVIRIPRWVDYKTDGTYGRIYVPTDPYM